MQQTSLLTKVYWVVTTLKHEKKDVPSSCGEKFQEFS